MFDDPKKELRRLQDALLEVEEPEEELMEEPLEEDTLFDQPWYTELLPEENPAVDFGRTLYADEDLEEPYALENAVSRAGKREKRREESLSKKEKKEKKKKKKGIAGLVLLAMAEIAAILYLLRWWIIWLT